MRLETAEHWRERHLDIVPRSWRMLVKKAHQRRGGDYSPEANGWLLDLADRMRGIKVPVGLTDDEICQMADRCAAHAMALPDLPVIHTVTGYRERLEKFVSGYGIQPPERERITRNGKRVGVADVPAIKRMTDSQWWRRALRRYQARALEREAIGLGIVHKRAEIYSSNATVERRGQQLRRNAAALENSTALNLDTGELYSLADLAALGVSNKAIRRGELMVRIRGFEEVAKGLGDAAEFVTVTCPSRMHAKRIGDSGAVLDNARYDGTTPREAHQYLGKVWQRARAALHRLGIRIYGFRIAEPHHDATPHWHMLFFVNRWLSAGRSAVGRFRAVIRRYFLADSATEPGAKRNRVKFVAIDPAKGTAAGYVAKYVSKNIDGYQVQRDFEADADAVSSAPRVEAWASTWGIRQFQPVGGPPVTVWRELRRIREESEEHGEEMIRARAAADAGNWRAFVETMGGPVVKRDDLPIRPAYSRDGEKIIGGDPVPAELTRYGEVPKGAIFGVREVWRGRCHVSRFYRWEIRRSGGAGGVGFRGSRTRVNNCTREGSKDDGTGHFAKELEPQIRGRIGGEGLDTAAAIDSGTDRTAGVAYLRSGDGNRGIATEGG